MTAPHRGITISTLGDLLDRRFRLHAHCRGCGHSRVVDLPALADRLGRDRSYIGGLPLVCAACGGRDAAITIEPPAIAPSTPKPTASGRL